MDEEYLSWLLLIPGIGRKRAELLATKYPSIEALRAASASDVAAVEGFGPVLAKRVKEFVEVASTPGGDYWYKGEAGLYLCPNCGALIGRDATSCPFCHAALEGEEAGAPVEEFPELAKKIDDLLQPEGQALSLCPNCGALVGKDVSACPKCGTVLEGEEPAAPEGVAAPGEEIDLLQPEGQGLYLCPECGALVSEAATACPKCGATLEGEEETAPAEATPAPELPPEAISGEGALFVCTNCGAFLRAEDMKCPSCGIEFEEGAVAEAAPTAEAEAGQFFPICPNCGALVPGTAKKCGICGHRMGEPVPEKETAVADEPGITKDFLERWRRVAEDKAGVTPTRKLLQELEQYDLLLAADPSLEKVWLKKIGILLRLNRVADAVAGFEKLADLNPAKDEDYRLQVLSVLRAQGDVSLLPKRWSQIRATEPARELVRSVPKTSAPTPATPVPEPAKGTEPEARDDLRKVADALSYYERLLLLDPTLAVAWQTKAELLGRLGRTAEAAEARRRAEQLVHPAEGETRTSPARAIPRAEGRINGTGRTNGRINGTGRVNGRTNGMVVATGRTNGMTSGVAPGEGMVNGLVNGNGLTNGRRGRWAPPAPASSRSWTRSVVGIASVVLLLLLMPILATLLSTSPPPGGISIDGRFGDWTGVPAYADTRGDLSANPDVDLTQYRVVMAESDILVSATVDGVLFRGGAGGADAIYAFVDEDGLASTGFQIGDLGADRAVEFYGWDGSTSGSTVWVYNAARAGPISDDWRAFDIAGGATAASDLRRFEAQIPVGPNYTASAARILFHSLDAFGDGDAADGVVGTETGALAVTERVIAPETVGATGQGFLRIDVRALAIGSSVTIDTLTVAKLGNVSDSAVTAQLFLDSNTNGALDGADVSLGTSGVTPAASFSIGRAIAFAQPETYFLAADIVAPAPNASVGFRIASMSTATGVPVTITTATVGTSYVAAAPANVTIDGAFADWDRYALQLDGDDDVQTLNYTGTVNENIDLRAYEAVVNGNVSVYFRVDGRFFGGVDIPNTRGRTLPPRAIDSDGDTVPDDIETTIDPALAFDFNNDNVSDLDQWEDVDQDGILDYNKCPGLNCTAYVDVILETTLPAWFPPGYAGNVVRRYVGPITLPPQRGVDTAVVYVDRDNRTDTGLLVTVDAIPYGFDYAFQALGRGGRIIDSGLYAYNASRPIPWERIGDASSAIDTDRLEASLPGTLLNLSANRTFLFYTTDWRFASDNALAGSGIRRAPGPWTRSVNGNNVVINEISPAPNPEWLEVANPTASAINMNGWTLQRKQGNNWNTFYTYTQTIGAWGSGSEYLVVNFAANTLPNGQNTVRLVASNGTEIDRTTYASAVGTGQTWARFKHATTGKPVDTDTDANDFYISALPSKGTANDRHRPRITVAKIANRATAAPGDLITYTLYYNNTDTGRANHVWINDTLPSDVAFVSSSVAYDSTDGKVYRWHFTNVGPLSPNSFTITVRVNATAGNGQVLRNTGALNYTDQLNRKQTASLATANTTVVRPVIVVVKIVDKATAMPGDTLTYTVFYNNTGSAVANHVWINDTLPVGVTYQNANPAPNQVNGQVLSWHFTNVAVGSHSLTITATVNANPPGVLVNWAFLNYTAQNDYKLTGSQDDAITMIPEFETLALPIAIPLVLYVLRRWRKKEG